MKITLPRFGTFPKVHPFWYCHLSVSWIGGLSENEDKLEKISSTVNMTSSVGKIAMPVIYQLGAPVLRWWTAGATKTHSWGTKIDVPIFPRFSFTSTSVYAFAFQLIPSFQPPPPPPLPFILAGVQESGHTVWWARLFAQEIAFIKIGQR